MYARLHVCVLDILKRVHPHLGNAHLHAFTHLCMLVFMNAGYFAHIHANTILSMQICMHILQGCLHTYIYVLSTLFKASNGRYKSRYKRAGMHVQYKKHAIYLHACIKVKLQRFKSVALTLCRTLTHVLKKIRITHGVPQKSTE